MNPNNYMNITANGSYTITNQLTVLDSIIVNTKAGSGNTCVVKSGSSTIGTIDTVNFTSNSIPYNLLATEGIQIVVGGGTAPDLTVLWR